MTTWNETKKIALELPETEEKDHIDTEAVRVRNKIFIQLSAQKHGKAVVKLPVELQKKLIKSDAQNFSAPSHWGKFGWTEVNLKNIDKPTIKKLIEESWSSVAPKSLLKNLKKES